MRVVERYDGDAIRKLEAKTVDGVINNDHLREILILEYPQVLYIYVFKRLIAVLSVKSVINQLLIFLQIVQHTCSLLNGIRLNH